MTPPPSDPLEHAAAEDLLRELDRSMPLAPLLGHLNFSEGKPDARFQRQWAQAQALVGSGVGGCAAIRLIDLLRVRLWQLQRGGGAAFANCQQAEAVLDLLRDRLLPAYRDHHSDLLGHLSADELFQPYFTAVAAEALLAQGGSSDDAPHKVEKALAQLNDFVGYRPVAVLENRRKGEVYRGERLRPIPLYLRDAGVGPGPYAAMLDKALTMLGDTPESLLDEAHFELERLAEWASDPRAHDHGHPANRRPNHIFGEWDADALDSNGAYRRYVTRQFLLECLDERTRAATEADKETRLVEGAAVAAGTLLMASAMSGRAPTSHGSTVNFGTLVPRVARLRDAFYHDLLGRLQGPTGALLREGAKRTGQPFGGVRQYLNQAIAESRARQLQGRGLAVLFARMGHAESALARARGLAAPAIRFATEILVRWEAARAGLDRGDLAEAHQHLVAGEALVRRGIACGAFVDPWNALGFQGQFPLSPAAEDSVHDHRLDELCRTMGQAFHLYGRLLCEAAAAGAAAVGSESRKHFEKWASWWDRFAAYEVTGLPRVHGAEKVTAARETADALAQWHSRGETPADLAFWRRHLGQFDSPAAYALAVDVLLRKEDFRAAMGLLIHWLSRGGEVALEDGEQSFHALAGRWLSAVCAAAATADGSAWALVTRFLDQLEANAEGHEDLTLSTSDGPAPEVSETPGGDDVLSAAYEEVTFRDSAADGVEGSVADSGPPLGADFPLEHCAEELGKKLRFVTTISRLWRYAAFHARSLAGGSGGAGAVAGWLSRARERRAELLRLLDRLQASVVPPPLGSQDSLVEYDRRRVLREQCVEAAVGAGLELDAVIRATSAVLDAGLPPQPDADWHGEVVHIESAAGRGDAAAVATRVRPFARAFRREALLYTPSDAGGRPRDILTVRIAQGVVGDLLRVLPRLGLLRETYQLLVLARDMERARGKQRRVVTEFNRLFQAGLQSLAEAVVISATGWRPPVQPSQLVHLLQTLARPFYALWVDHSRTVRLSTLEAVQGEDDWSALRSFVRRYGGDLFTPRFLNLANLRGVLGQGMATWLDSLADQAGDPFAGEVVGGQLLAGLERGLTRERAAGYLECVLKAVAENYEEYKDYNSTTTHSDYGQQLHRLLAFLRLKAGFERHAWNVRPLVWVHEVLERRGHRGAAELWRQEFERLTDAPARRHLEELRALQEAHGTTLRTVAELVETGFAQALSVDRLVALVGTALNEATPPGTERATSLAALEEALVPFTRRAGGGFEAPAWLRSMETEVQRAAEARTQRGEMAPDQDLPRVHLSLEQIEAQLAGWDAPLAEVPTEAG